MVKGKCPYWERCESYNTVWKICNECEGLYHSRYASCVKVMQKNDPSKIAIIIGTRAELIKMFPIMLELKKQKIDYVFIHTGQHSIQNLCDLLGVKTPDVILSKEPTTSSKFNTQESKAVQWAFRMILNIKRELKNFSNLQYILCHGDTLSTACASVASSKLLNPFKKYQSVHLESGLRSFSNQDPFPEEIIRKIVTKFSDILIAPSRQSKLNLKKYKNKRVIQLGNTILDSVYYATRISKKQNLKPFGKRFALVTIHRHENIKSKERLSRIVDILCSISIPVYFSLHDNTKYKLIEFGLYNQLKSNPNINFVKNIDYVSFIYQMSKCNLIICDGGSMQEESLIFKKPCIILRKNTERQEGLETNFQYLSNLNIQKTKEKVNEYLNPKFKIKTFENPYGKIGISKKIVRMLK